MEKVRITSRTLIAGYMREEGEIVTLYPWQARRLEDAGYAERVSANAEAETETEAETEAKTGEESDDELTEAFGEDLALTLKDAGYESVEQVRDADGEELLAVNGIGQATLRKVRKHDGSTVEPEA